MAAKGWKVYNPSGKRRVVVTKELPGDRWLKILAQADVRVEYGTETRILKVSEIKAAIGNRCDGARKAGGTVYSNYAVGYNNVDVDAATKRGIPVGNTPGVLTETTAEMAVALTLSAARRVPEADVYMRGGSYEGWLPTLFLGELLARKTVGVIGAGRIGAAYAKMMVEGFKMDFIYYDIHQNRGLEKYFREYSKFLRTQGEAPVRVTRARTVEEVLKRADVVSLHPLLDETTHHLINAKRLRLTLRGSCGAGQSRRIRAGSRNSSKAWRRGPHRAS
ncbi:MAG: hypothetical protein IFK92_06585 [Acidobacteria bacterium]|nr:hypothetical protein [Candidatus Sulfomarinibacter kjeldsenii]